MAHHKILSPNVFAMLHKVYKADAQTLNDVVSDVVDVLLEYNGWAIAERDNLTVSEATWYDIKRRLVDVVNTLHGSMGRPLAYGVELYTLVDYAVGVLANNFWPVNGG